MNIDFEVVVPQLKALHESLEQRLRERRPHAAPHIARTAFLQSYLNLFIRGSVSDDFKMGRLPDNRHVTLERVMGLYDLVAPSKDYAKQQHGLMLIMSRLEYDLDLNDDPKYGDLIASLLDDRYPVKEVGEFGTLTEFLRREGSFWLKDAQREEGRYVLDLSRYKQYAVRPQYRPYGCRAIIDDDFNVVSVDGVGTDDPQQFAAGLATLKSTLIMDVIVHCHAVICHLLVSQKLFLAASTTHYAAIAADPVLSDLYYLCTYRTNAVNSNVPVLAGSKGSLFQIGFGFTSHAFGQLMSDLVTDSSMQTPADIKRQLIDSRCTHWKRIAEPIYGAVDRFVERCVGDKLPEDFKLQTKVSLFVSTFFHEMVGDLQLKTIFNCDLNSRNYAEEPFERRTDEFAYIVAAQTIGVSVRILKLCDLVRGDYLTGESLSAWSALYKDFTGVLRDQDWINVDNFEFSVGY